MNKYESALEYRGKLLKPRLVNSQCCLFMYLFKGFLSGLYDFSPPKTVGIDFITKESFPGRVRLSQADQQV